MKILVDYEPSTGGLTLPDNSYCFAPANLSFDEYNSRSDVALELVKQGMTADDLVKLKNMGII